MALWSVDIEKSLDPETWTNRYIVEAGDISLAGLSAQSIVNIERAVHADIVSFLRFRVSDLTPGTDIFTITDINEVGEVDTSVLTGEYLPLFNVVRVDFAAEQGRPSRKYLRCPVFEEWQHNGILESSIISFFNSNYASPMAALGAYVDVDGQQIVGGSTVAKVGMRQLRRGSKRRARTVLPSP